MAPKTIDTDATQPTDIKKEPAVRHLKQVCRGRDSLIVPEMQTLGSDHLHVCGLGLT